MKTLRLSLFVIVLFIAGCKKDSTNNTPTNTVKIYLISKITHTAVPFGFVTTEQYTYDALNRVIELKSNKDFKYTYDSDNKLLTATTYDLNNNLLSTDKYTYAGNLVTANRTDETGAAAGSYVFTLNSNQTVARLDLSNVDYMTCTYDSNNNITGYSLFGTLTQSDTYTYDSKKNPLSMIGAVNLHLEFMTKGESFTSVNNILKESARPTNFTYTYNSDGFPVTAVVTGLGGQGETTTYEYITK